MLDAYFNGDADRLCQEAPVPVVQIRDRHYYPGGAANTAVNVHHLGGTAQLLSVIGKDAEGERLQHLLQQQDLTTADLLQTSDRTTLAKQRFSARSHLLMRCDQGSTEALSFQLEQTVIARLVQHFPNCDAVLLSDYGYGIFTPNVIDTVAKLQAQFPRPLTIDSKRLSVYRAITPAAVKPNYQEAIQLLNLPHQTTNRVEQLSPYGDRLLSLTGAAIVAVTLDREGVMVFESEQSPYHIPTQPASDCCTSGAGDTFISALTLALMAGATARTAAEIAVAATALVVKQSGTTPCDGSELRSRLTNIVKIPSTPR